jgi:hypothetical protein
MYTAEQVSKIKEEFWLKLGKYLAPVPGANGEKLSWINYKTGIKDVHFKMNATRDGAGISIEIIQKDPATAERIYRQFELLRPDFENAMGESWEWQPYVVNEHQKPLARIGLQLNDVNVLRQEDWPIIISFLKPRIMLLDQFWNNNKMIFEMLL